VFLADRVIVLGANPGRVRGEVAVDLPRPHNRTSPRFKELVDRLYEVMTNPSLDMARAWEPADAPAPAAAPRSPYARPLPHVRVGTISGLLELIVESGDDAQEVARLADRLALPVDDLLAILDAAVLLGFAVVSEGDVRTTEAGRDFANATIQHSKDIFRHQVLASAPIVATIAKTLTEKENRAMRGDFFLDLLDEYYPAEEARRQFQTAVEWGRYAELFEYDAEDDRLFGSDTLVAAQVAAQTTT